jgi:ferredoxin-like protein FixX
MPQWFVRGLHRGVVTTRYPAHADSSARALPSPPAFRPASLTREVADALAEICPSTALTRADGILLFDVGACTACGRCREQAREAITSSAEFELAATDRTALVKRIPLLGEVSE